MKGKIIAIAIVAIFLIAGLVYFVIPGSAWWEEDTNLGQWGVEILIHYADGTTESLKTMQEYKIFTQAITKGGIPIVSFEYKIKAKATGDYTNVYITSQYSKIGINYAQLHAWALLASGGSWVYERHWDTDIDVTVPVDGQWHDIYSRVVPATDFGALPNGDYVLHFNIDGQIKYKPDTETAYATATNPSERFVAFSKVGSTLELILDSSAT